jgi:predicted nucleic acid-binding protein
MQMPDRAFFDTNVLVYAFASDDPKSAKAETALAAGGVASVQIFNEFANVCRRKLDLSWNEIAVRIDVLKALLDPPAPITMSMHEAALALARAHKLAFYDALVIAAAQEAKADVLLTEDLQDGRKFGALRVRNPFKD